MTLPYINVWEALLVFVATIGVMEIIAIWSHKYVMHGFLWSLHKSHHEPRTGWFEKNDWFAVMGAVPAIILLVIGTSQDIPMLTAIGAGITGYGAIYFLFHDILVHRRIRHRWNPNRGYFKQVVQAHRLHHIVESKDGTVSFGFVYARPVRALLADLERNGKGRVRASAKTRIEMDIGNAEKFQR